MKGLFHTALALGIPTMLSSAVEAPRFIHATPENTTHESGTAHEPAEGDARPDGRWYSHPTGGFAAAGAAGNNAPLLRTLVTGLEQNANYEVYGFFGAEHPAFGDIRMGIAIASMDSFAPDHREGASDQIGVQDPQKRVALIEGSEEGSGPRKFRASLGVARSDANGTLVIFADDHPNDALEAGTHYLGYAVQRAPEDASPDVGGGSPQVVVDAARAADHETLWREIAAGADLNTPDREGRTALFYACISGDHEWVAALMKAGAMPDCEGQRLPPLWAAAHLGDTPLVQMLLDAGAEITTACLSSLQLGVSRGGGTPVQINPISAAVLSGCVETLESLLDHRPDIDLEKAVFGSHYEFSESSVAREKTQRVQTTQTSLINLSVNLNHFEMAAWMVRRGIHLEHRESWNLPSSDDLGRHGAVSIMLSAILRKNPQLNLVNALADRGVPLIDTRQMREDPVIVPWDALSAAAFAGHQDLVRQWLPMAIDAPIHYRIRLITLAEASGNQEVSAEVRRAYPDTPRPGIESRGTGWLLAKNELLASDAFVPRTRRPATAAERDGTTRIAVIGEGQAEGPAAAFAAILSTEEGIEVVDREQISKILIERSIDHVSDNISGQLNEIGDLLLADFIVIASSFGNGRERVLRFEAHNVATGLTLHRAFYAADAFEPQTFTRGFLEDLMAKRGAFTSGKPSTAISLIGVTPERSLMNGPVIAGAINAGLLQEIDGTPGLIAMTRDQLAPIVQEHALAGDGTLWSAAWLLEGDIRATDEPGKVMLALRATPAAGGNPRDVSVDGSSADLQELVMQAWRALGRTLDFLEQSVSTSPEHRNREASRLAREADWLMGTSLARQAAPLADAAFYLGGATPDAWERRLKAHWFNSPLQENPRRQWKSSGMASQAAGYPLAPDVADYYASVLESQLEMLRYTLEAATQIRSGANKGENRIHSQHLRNLLESGDRLTAYRCWLTPQHMTAGQKALLAEFDDELSRLWDLMLDPAMLALPGARNSGDTLANLLRTTMHSRKLPWLVDRVVRNFYENPGNRISTNPMPRGVLIHNRWLSHLFDQLCHATFADVMERGLNEDSPYADLRRAEFAYLRATDKRTAQSRALARAWIDILTKFGNYPRPLFSRSQLENGAPSFPLHGFAGPDFLRPFDMTLRALISAPRNCPDTLFRYEHYMTSVSFYHHASYASPNEKRRFRNNRSRYQQIPKLLESKQASTADYALFLHGLHEADATYAINTASHISSLIRDLALPETDSTFGESGGFSYLTYPDAISAELLKNLVGDPGMQGAMITKFAINPNQPDLLWAVVNPYQDRLLVMHQNSHRHFDPDDPLRLHLKQPYLVAINCNTGEMVHQINLPKAIFGISADPSYKNLGFHCRIQGSIGFNEARMALYFIWPTNNESRQVKWPHRLVTLDPMRGEVVATYKIGMKHPDHEIVGVDDSFYFLADDNPGIDQKSLHCITPENQIQTLSQYGRRPSQSPFDEHDRAPRNIFNDHGRLLVTSRQQPMHYDPGDGTWTKSPPQRNWYLYLKNLNEKNRENHLFFPNRHSNSGRFTTHNDGVPGALVYKDGETARRIPVATHTDAPYPTSFMISPGVTSQTRDLFNHIEANPPEAVSLDDLIRSDMVWPIVVQQTEDSLILALALAIPGAYIGHPPSSTRQLFLPFLWRISKEDVLQHLK